MNVTKCIETTIRNCRFIDSFNNNRQTIESKDNNDCYQFGEYFYYSDTMKQDDHYCQAKYKTLRDELTQNKLESISIEEWNKTQSIAQHILNEMDTYYNNKSNKSNYIDTKCFDKFGIRMCSRDYPYYNQRYNIKYGTKITVLHLMSVILYFNHSKLATMICKTFRAWNKHETYDQIKDRHCNFVNIIRYICETIVLYGNDLPTNTCVYRGVNNASFEWLDACWNGPLSTTIDINVSKTFAKSNGTVLKLNNSESGFAPMYINGCKILSKFPKEKEYLMWSPCLQIIDIPLYKNKFINIYESISAIRLLQKLVNGHLLSKQEKNELLNETIQNKLLELMQSNSNNSVVSNQSHIQIIESLFQTTLNKVLKTETTIWINPNLKVNNSIQREIKQYGLQENCQVKTWRMQTNELYTLLLPWLIKDSIKEYNDSNNEYIVNKVTEFNGIENNIQMNECWECNVNFNGNSYLIKVAMLMIQSSNVITNQFYDIHVITYEYPMEINENNLMLSFDLLCDELDICLHFCPRKVSIYRQRSHTHIVSAQQIETLIKKQSCINWSVAFRYFYD